MSKKIVETMKCGRCQDKQPGSLKNNITYPPRGWKRYPDKGTTILLCKKCRQKFRKIFTIVELEAQTEENGDRCPILPNSPINCLQFKTWSVLWQLLAEAYALHRKKKTKNEKDSNDQ